MNSRQLFLVAAIYCFQNAVIWAREVPIVILHTCDLHGNILPTESYDAKTNVGGMARCASVIRQVRSTEKNVLLLDAGDTIQGAPVSYYSQGDVMVRILNLLRYDAWCWGNHEFDWGLPTLTARAKQAEVPILNANVSGTGELVALIKPYRLVEVDGIKVGIIGLNTPGIPNWSRPRLIPGLKFMDSVEALRPIVPAMRKAGAQVLVLVCHQGYRDGGDDHANQVGAIARTFPELDVILGGHTHRNFPEFKINNVLYCQADYFGIHLGRVDLTYDTVAGKLTRRESKTMLMDETVPLDPEVLDACGVELELTRATLATVIGEASAEIDVRASPKRESPIHNLICESIAEALSNRNVKVDAVVHGIFERRGIAQGPIAVADVWKILPYENTVGVLRLTPQQLKGVLEENAAAYERREFRGVWGLRWTFDPAGTDSNRVISVTHADGSPLKADDRVAVAFNSYELASGGLRWNKLRELADLPETQLIEVDVQTRQAMIDYIRGHGSISPVTNGWWKAERATTR